MPYVRLPKGLMWWMCKVVGSVVEIVSFFGGDCTQKAGIVFLSHTHRISIDGSMYPIYKWVKARSSQKFNYKIEIQESSEEGEPNNVEPPPPKAKD